MTESEKVVCEILEKAVACGIVKWTDEISVRSRPLAQLAPIVDIVIDYRMKVENDTAEVFY